MSLLKSSWVAALLGVIFYAATTWMLWSSAATKLASAPKEEDKPNEPPPSWSFQNPEVEQLIEELKKGKEVIQGREQKLDDLEKRLQSERQEINLVLQATQQLRKEFDAELVRVRDEETANLKKLAKIYTAMTPAAAASVFKELTDEQVVKIMVFMKDAETAPIFESMAKTGQKDAKRVAALSERLRMTIYRANEKPKS